MWRYLLTLLGFAVVCAAPLFFLWSWHSPTSNIWLWVIGLLISSAILTWLAVDEGAAQAIAVYLIIPVLAALTISPIWLIDPIVSPAPIFVAVACGAFWGRRPTAALIVVLLAACWAYFAHGQLQHVVPVAFGFVLWAALTRWIAAGINWVMSPLVGTPIGLKELAGSMFTLIAFVGTQFFFWFAGLWRQDPAAFSNLSNADALPELAIFAIMLLTQGGAFKIAPASLGAMTATATCMVAGMLITVVYVGKGVTVLASRIRTQGESE